MASTFFGVEAEADSHDGGEAFQEQARAHDQDDGERHLGHGQGGAPTGLRLAGRLALTALQTIAGRGAPCLAGGGRVQTRGR